MYWNNWIPEITLMILLMLQLVALNVKKTFFGLLPTAFPVLVISGLLVHLRFSTDVTEVEMTSLLALQIDPWSYFGRTVGLFALFLSIVA